MGYLDKFKLDGKLAIVTGGSRGIGASVTQGLVEAGATVLITATTSASAEEAAAAIDAASGNTGRVRGVACDVASQEEVRGLFTTAGTQFGPVDILFNNAGISNADAFLVDLTEDQIRRLIDVNLLGTIFCAQEAARVMAPRQSGSIINMASMTAHIYNVPQRTTHYAASKGAVLSFTRALAAELAPAQVRVNAVSPGYHLTEMAKQWESKFPLWLERIPMGHFADPYDLSGTIIYLASAASSYVTGAEIVVDGGYTLL